MCMVASGKVRPEVVGSISMIFIHEGLEMSLDTT